MAGQQKQKTAHSLHGFTIVELLIVILVIAILAAIVIVAYTGIQDKANNSSRQSEAQQVAKLLLSYKAQNDAWPPMPSGITSVCVGDGFSDLNSDGQPDCWDAFGGAASHPYDPFNAALRTVGSLPIGNRVPINSSNHLRLGPVFMLSGTTATVRYWVKAPSCPSGTQVWSDGITVQCTLGLDM